MVVKQEFEKVGIQPLEVPFQKKGWSKLVNRLTELGFEILDDKNKKLIGKTKAVLIEKVQTGEIEEHFSLGDYYQKNSIRNTHS